MDSLISTQWLADELGAPDLVVIDASKFLDGRDAAAEYRAAHIPGARFLDIGKVADPDFLGANMLPSAADFAAAMESLGVGSDDRIVVYDNSPLRSATRGWFMLRHFGARQVAVLDGGLGKWLAEGRATESGEPEERHARFEATGASDVVTKDDVLGGFEMPLVDARDQARFEGTSSDPRPNVADGHIPGSRNLPFASLWNADGTLKPNQELRAAFAASGIDPARPFVASCGSGVTANSLLFAAHLLGNDETRLYDGSWSEYGADPATPKALGPA